jgi:phosphoribosylanthranilate isomerase
MTQRTRIKICGIRRPQDALVAARAGADAIGLVFHPPAPRRVSAEQAAAILEVLPAFVTPVGLFVDAELAFVRETVTRHHLRHVQFNGSESPEYIAGLKELAVIKAVRVDSRFGETLDAWRRAVATGRLTNLKGLVLETGATREPGGTGVPNDWKAVREQQARGGFDGLPPIIAAGGLRPDTVGAVVRSVRPWAVDVSSGVEQSLGEKSAEKIGEFVRAVREADAGISALKSQI